MNTDVGEINVAVRAHDAVTGEDIPLTELKSFNPWPMTVLEAAVQGLVMAVVLILAHLAGVI